MLISLTDYDIHKYFVSEKTIEEKNFLLTLSE